MERLRAFSLGSGLEAKLGPVATESSNADFDVLPFDSGTAATVLDAVSAAGTRLGNYALTELIEVLGRVGERFLDPDDVLRAEALRHLPESARLSPEMAAWVLDGMAADWTRSRLRALVDQDFPAPEVLDRFRDVGGRTLRARGPRFCTQIVAGSVPGVGVTALIRSLLVKSPTLLKPGRGDLVLPLLFHRGLLEEAPEVAGCAAVVYWDGGREEEGEELALVRSDVVVVYGSDETVADIRRRCPATTRIVAYRHRISFGVVGRAALDSGAVHHTANAVAEAASAFEQRGCVCPGTIFVEEGGEVDSEAFAAELAAAMGRLEEGRPPPPPLPSEAARLQQERGTAEIRAAAAGGRVWHGGASGGWTVVWGGSAAPSGGGCPRFVRVVPVADAAAVAPAVRSWRPHLQTVAHAGLGDRLPGLAEEWSALGVSRVAGFTGTAFPPPWWLHDGAGPLRVLVEWSEIESD